MTTHPPLPLLLLWLAWVLQAVLSAMNVRRFGRRLTKPSRHFSASDYRPPVLVIVPFKGLEKDLAAGVRALCEQHYHDYELVLVVESEDDPACPVLREELARYPRIRSQLLVAGIAGPAEGQKVHNQLFALDQLTPRLTDDHVLVFADSDAVCTRDWLAHMIAPLRAVKHTGLTTGYRWLVPEPRDGAARPTLWAQLASVINSSAACMLGRARTNMAWGGSMAIRASTARQFDLRSWLVGALTDDYQFTRFCRRHNQRIVFLPQMLVPTPVDFTFASLANFAHRQYLITRVYAPGVFAFALAVCTLYAAGLATAWWYLIRTQLNPSIAALWPWPAATLALVFTANLVRSHNRRTVAQQAFDPATLAKLKTAFWFDRYATWLWMLLHLALASQALLGRTMTWRNIRYRLLGPQKVQRLG